MISAFTDFPANVAFTRRLSYSKRVLYFNVGNAIYSFSPSVDTAPVKIYQHDQNNRLMPIIIIFCISADNIIRIPAMICLHGIVTEQEIGMLDISGLPDLTAGSCVIISKIRSFPVQKESCILM